jgi:REP element-mobilizing transposase RayT
MPRRPRQEAAGAVHHVVFQGNGRCRIVLDRVDAERLWTGFGIVSETHQWECIAACLLGTHFHTFLRTEEPNLGEGMQRLLGSYSRWFNLRHGREGHLFRSPFWSKRVVTNEHLLVGASYVALNAVRAGLCAHPSEWRWTTHRELAGLEPQKLVHADGLPSWLGNNDLERRQQRSAPAEEKGPAMERILALRLCERRERTHHLADDSRACSIEHRAQGEHHPVMALAAAGSGGYQPGVVLDVVGYDRAPVLLGPLEHHIVGHAPVAARELGRGDDVYTSPAELPCDLGRPHLIEKELHATPASSRAARSSSAVMRASISSR